MKNIIFIGMPGAGKTTIGKEVARTLAWPFFDSLKELYDERYALYLAAADLHISVRGGIKETVEAVLAALREQGVVEG